MIVYTKDKDPQENQSGLLRSVLSHGEKLMLVEVSIKKGTVVAAHQHPHEQITYMVDGSVRFNIEGKKFVLATGESCLIRPEELHGVEALTDCVLIDTFSPPRESFLK